MFDEPMRLEISLEFTTFCMNDHEQVDRSYVHREIEAVPIDGVHLSRDVQLPNGKIVTVANQRRGPLGSEGSASHVIRHSETTSFADSALENLSIFMLPGQSLFDQKDFGQIFDRVVQCARFHQTREIALQAMYVLLVIRSWLGTMRQPEGPLDVPDERR